MDVAAGREQARRHVDVDELDGVRSRALQRLHDPELLHEPRDQGALAAVHAHLDPWIVPDRDEAALHRADRAARELADEDVAVVDVRAHHRAGLADHPLGDEVAEDADDGRQVRVHEPVAEIDHRRAVALERGDADPTRVDVGWNLSQRRLRVDPLRVLLVCVVDVRRTDPALVDQLLHVPHGRAVAEREPDLRLQALCCSQVARPQRVAEVVRDRLLDENVLARLERRHRDLEMVAVAGDDVDHVDVVPVEQDAVVGGHVRDLVLPCRLVRRFLRDVADGDELAARVAFPAGKVGHVRPPPGADHSDS